MLSHRHHFVTMGTESLQAKVALLLLPRTFAQVPKQDGQRVRVLLLILKNRTHVLCLGQSTLHKPFHTVDCAENSKRRWELVAKLLAEKTAGLILIGIPIWYFDIFPRRLLYRDLLRKRIKSQNSTGFLISSIHCGSQKKKKLSFYSNLHRGMNSFVEECLNLQEQIPTTVQPVQRNPANEKMKDNMEINKELCLINLHIHP